MEKKDFCNLKQDKEREQIFPKEVWIVDDDDEIIKKIVEFWQIKTNGLGCSFKYFETGQSALNEINERQEAQKKLPDLVFIDGLLEKDQGEIKKGENFVKEIREMEKIKQPKIIAHSTAEECNNKMLKAGADLAFTKGQFRESTQFLQEFLSSCQKKNEK